MPVIVAFGDSNTWGYDPATGGRFPRAQRWPSVLQRELGAEFEVIAEGLNGRTTVHDDPIEPYRNGADALPPCLMSHAPVDFVIIALGCNDLKKRFSVSAFDIAEGAGRLIALARAYGQRSDARPPKILLIAPPSDREALSLCGNVRGRAGKVLASRPTLSRRRGARRRRLPGRRPGHPLFGPRRHPLRGRSARTARLRCGGGDSRSARASRCVHRLGDAAQPHHDGSDRPGCVSCYRRIQF